MKGKVVNLIAGAGSGKSTLAAGVFYNLKMRGYCPEIAHEWVKEEFWNKNDAVVEDQIYIFAKQRRRIFAPLERGADVVICDSPLVLQLYYNGLRGNHSPELEALILAEHNKLDNINIFVRRQKRYEQRGRWGTEADSIAADEAMKALLVKHNIPFIELDGNELAPGIVTKLVEEKLNASAP